MHLRFTGYPLEITNAQAQHSVKCFYYFYFFFDGLPRIQQTVK